MKNTRVWQYNRFGNDEHLSSQVQNDYDFAKTEQDRVIISNRNKVQQKTYKHTILQFIKTSPKNCKIEIERRKKSFRETEKSLQTTRFWVKNMQKEPFWTSKGALSHSETNPFTTRNEPFRNEERVIRKRHFYYSTDYQRVIKIAQNSRISTKIFSG